MWGMLKQRDAHRSIHVSFVRIPSHATLEVPLTVLHFQNNPIGGAFISEVVYLDLTVLLQKSSALRSGWRNQKSSLPRPNASALMVEGRPMQN